MLKKRISILLVILMVVSGIFVSEPKTAVAATKSSSYYKNLFEKVLKAGKKSEKKDKETNKSTEEIFIIETEVMTEEVVGESTCTEETIMETIKADDITETATIETTKEDKKDVVDEIADEVVSENEVTMESTSLVKEEVIEEKITITEIDNKEEETTISMGGVQAEISNNINDKIGYYESLAKAEADWLWSQQMSNGAFAFYNEINGTVRVNPYFSEIVAIALINYDDSNEAKNKIKRYMDWHFAHINSTTEDYNGLAGTIYDYTAIVKDGIVVSESTERTYDSTDSYSALFIKVLADYAKVYGDTGYLVEHESLIKDITNVIFANLSSNGYSYAKPDYKIRYLMDNSEVYAGLVSAKYIYSNIINDTEMLKKINNTVEFYNNNFDKHWWKNDHYAPTLSTKYEEHNEFSWNNFYPNATSQIFPIIYDVIDSNSSNAKILYEGLCDSWDWQDMDYISEGVDVFCWGSFALVGAKMNDVSRFDAYVNKYKEIVDGGRLYPLYSSEAAMVLMGLDTMIDNLKN